MHHFCHGLEAAQNQVAQRTLMGVKVKVTQQEELVQWKIFLQQSSGNTLAAVSLKRLPRRLLDTITRELSIDHRQKL